MGLLDIYKNNLQNNEDESKKKYPKGINPNLFDNPVGVADGFYRAAPTNNWVMEADKRFKEHGWTQNPYTDLNKELYNNQSFGSKLFNSIGQTLVGEVLAGSAAGIADIGGFIYGAVTNQFGNDYINYRDNEVSNKINEWKEKYNQEIAPIYTDPNKNIANGGLLDSSWWFSNLPSIASSLTLFIPAVGVTKGLSLLSKVARINKFERKTLSAINKAGRKLQQGSEEANKLTSKISSATGKALEKIGSQSTVNSIDRFTNFSTNAALQRLMENYQESRQEYNDVYDKSRQTIENMHNTVDDDGVNSYYKFIKNHPEFEGMTDEQIADKIAKKSADTTFKDDNINFVFDLLELYGVNKAWKGFKSIKAGNKLNRLNNNAGRYLGTDAAKSEQGLNKSVKSNRTAKLEKELENATAAKNEEQIKSLNKQLNRSKKFDDLKNHLNGTYQGVFNGTKGLVLNNIGEGAEEAINYASQQEGDYVASRLLGTDDYKSFDQRTRMYVNSPQLWESAFWGFLGGILFNAGHEKVHEVFDKDKLINEKIREAEIIQRAKQFEDLRSDIEKIKKGENIFATLDKDKKFDVNDEAMLNNVVNRRLQQYAFDLSLNAASVGNLDLLKGYISDENVRKAFVDAGILSEEDSKSQMKSLNNIIDKAQDTFDSHYLQLIDLSGQLSNNGTDKYNIINDAVVQSLARNNALRDFTNSLLVEANNNLQKKIDTLSTDPVDGSRRSDLKMQQEYERLLRSQYIGVQLAQLKATEEVLKNDHTVESIAALPNIRKQITTLESIAKDDESANGVYVDWLALQGTIDRMGKFTFGTTTASTKYEENLNEKYKESDQHILDEFNRFKKEGNSSRSGESDLSYLATNYKSMFDMLQTKVANDIDMRVNKDQRINNLEDLKHSHDLAKTWADSLEKNAAKDAIDRIAKLATKYGSETISNIIGQLHDNTDRATYFASELDDTERKLLSDDIDTLKLTSPTAQTAIEQIKEVLSNIKLTETMMHVDTLDSLEETTTEDSTTSEENSPTDISKEVTSINSVSFNPTNGNISLTSTPGYINLEATQEGGEIKITSTDSVSFNSELYDTTDSTPIDKSKKYEVKEVPVLEKEDDKIKVKSKGLLRRLEDEGSAEESSSSSTGGETIPETSVTPTVSITPESTTPPASASSSTPTKSEVIPQSAETPESSTGLESAIPQSTDELDDKTKDIISKRAAIQKDATRLTLNEIKSVVENSQSIDEDSITSNVLNKLKSSLSEEEIKNNNVENRIRRTVKNFLKRGIDTKIVENADRVAKVAESTLNLEGIQLSDILEKGKSVNNLRVIYGNAFEELLKSYLEDVGGSKVDDKYYINLTELMAYVNDIFEDNIANNLFDTMNWYINQDDVKDRYVFTDGKPKSKEDFINNVTKTRAERYQDEEGGYHTFLQEFIDGVNIANEIKIGDETYTAQQYKEAIDNLKEGDVLESKTDGKKVWFYGTDNSGNKIPVSSMTIPDVVGSEYIMPIGALLVGTKLKNGNIDSKLNNKLKKLNNSNDINSKKIKEILTAYSYIDSYKLSDEDKFAKKLALVQEFEKSDFVKELINDGILDKIKIEDDGTLSIIDNEAGLTEYNLFKELDYLSKIWSFTNKHIPVMADELRDDYLNKWFERIDNNYSKTVNLAYNLNNKKVSVHGVTGEKFIISKNANPVTTAIAGGYKPSIHKLAGTSDKYAMGELMISGMSNRSFGSNGNTFVVIPRPDGELAYVNSYGVTASDKNLGVEAKQIMQEIYDTVDLLIDNYNSIEGKRALGKFFRSILSEGGGANATRGLFASRREFITIDNGDGTTSTKPVWYNSSLKIGNKSIILNLNNYNIKFNLSGDVEHIDNVEIKNSIDNSTIVYYVENKAEIKQFLKDQISQLQFAQNFEYLHGDNVDNNDTNKAAQHVYEGGKKIFIINVDGKHPHRFESYSDFILSQNCVNITTEVQNGSNMTKRSDSLSEVELYIDIEDINNKETEDEIQETPPVEENETSMIDEVLKVINDDTITDKSDGIVNAIFSQEELSKLKKFKLADLLPKNVIFAEDLNEGVTIDSNPITAKGPILEHIDSDKPGETPGTIKIGNRFLAMVKSPLYRKQARNKLIHEQLHEILSNPANRVYVNQLKDVFKEFKTVIENDPKGNKDLIKYLHNEFDTDSRFANLTDKAKEEAIEDLRVEEFLVESLTSKELFDKLNEIKTESTKGYKLTKKESEKSLFQKIADILRKLFNWKGKSDTLYAKEWNLLNEVLSEDNIETVDEVEESVEIKEEESTTAPPVQRYETEKNYEEIDEDDLDIDFEDSNFIDTTDIYTTNNGVTLELDTSVYNLSGIMPIDKIENFASKIDSAEISFSCR